MHSHIHTHTFKARWVTGLRFQAMVPLESIMAWHTAIWLLLIHGPISCLHTPVYQHRPAQLKASKLDCAPYVGSLALLSTKAGSLLSCAGHLGFITQIPIRLRGGGTSEYVTILSAVAFHVHFDRISNFISSQMLSICFL